MLLEHFLGGDAAVGHGGDHDVQAGERLAGDLSGQVHEAHACHLGGLLDVGHCCGDVVGSVCTDGLDAFWCCECRSAGAHPV